MKKIFLFIMIIFFVPNVFASNTNVSSKVKYSTDSAKGTYKGDEIYLGGYNGLFSINTRYNGRLAMVSFYINVNDYNFTTNHTYTITLNMATEDWRNHFMGPQVFEANSSGTLGSSLNASNFRFVSMKQIKFNFKTDGSLPTYIFFRVYSTDYASPTGNTAITGVNNWNLSSIYINNNVSATPTPAPVTPAPTPTPQPSNKDIIDNAKQNTQDIINNQNDNTNSLIENNNQNTTDIIENNNQNSQNIIDNQNELLGNKCDNVLNFGTWHTTYTNNGLTTNRNGQSFSTTGTVTSNWGGNIGGTGSNAYNPNLVGGQQYYFCVNKTFLDNMTFRYHDGDTWKTVTLKSGCKSFTPINDITEAYWFWGASQYTVINVSDFQFYIGKTNNFCEFGSVSSKLDDVNDTIRDDNIDDKTGFFTDFQDNDFGLSSIITIPLTTIQQLTNTSCVALSVPIPFTNSNISLPCMTEIYENAIPTIFNIWQVVSFGIISYFICIDIFKMVKGFKDPNEDKVEVLDL